MTAALSPTTIERLRYLARTGAGVENAVQETGWDKARVKRVCAAYQIDLPDGFVEAEPLPKAEPMAGWVTLPVRMPRSLFERLKLEGDAIGFGPANVARAVVTCAFNGGDFTPLDVFRPLSSAASGDLSSLRSADPAEDGIRVCISSVASKAQKALKQK